LKTWKLDVGEVQGARAENVEEIYKADIML
jgi:hypothetical protein